MFGSLFDNVWECLSIHIVSFGVLHTVHSMISILKKWYWLQEARKCQNAFHILRMSISQKFMFLSVCEILVQEDDQKKSKNH